MPAPGNPVLFPGVKVTTANTADQVIASYLVAPGKKFCLSFLEANVRLTTFGTTATNFGTVSLEAPSGVKRLTFSVVAGPGVLNSPLYAEFPEALPIIGKSDGTTVVRVVCTPSAATSFTWDANIGGYEL